MTPWTVAHQAPLSMGILQARILEWVAIASPPGDLPNPRIVPGSPALQADSLSTEPPGQPQEYWSGLKGNSENLTNATVWPLRKRNEPCSDTSKLCRGGFQATAREGGSQTQPGGTPTH